MDPVCYIYPYYFTAKESASHFNIQRSQYQSLTLYSTAADTKCNFQTLQRCMLTGKTFVQDNYSVRPGGRLNVMKNVWNVEKNHFQTFFFLSVSDTQNNLRITVVESSFLFLHVYVHNAEKFLDFLTLDLPVKKYKIIQKIHFLNNFLRF